MAHFSVLGCSGVSYVGVVLSVVVCGVVGGRKQCDVRWRIVIIIVIVEGGGGVRGGGK